MLEAHPTDIRPFSLSNASNEAQSVWSELRCPQPFRPASPVQTPSGKQTKKRSAVTRNNSRNNDLPRADPEACKELQKILCEGYAYCKYETLDRAIAFAPEIPNKSVNSHSRKYEVSVPKNIPSPKSTASILTHHWLPKNSLTNTPTNSSDDIASDSSFSFVPPVRARNPLPMNSSFVNLSAESRAEFGLLSVSPPPCDDFEDNLAHARQSRIGTDNNNNNNQLYYVPAQYIPPYFGHNVNNFYVQSENFSPNTNSYGGYDFIF